MGSWKIWEGEAWSPVKEQHEQRPRGTLRNWRSWKSKVTGVGTRVGVSDRRQPHTLLEALMPGVPGNLEGHLGRRKAGLVSLLLATVWRREQEFCKESVAAVQARDGGGWAVRLWCVGVMGGWGGESKGLLRTAGAW